MFIIYWGFSFHLLSPLHRLIASSSIIVSSLHRLIVIKLIVELPIHPHLEVPALHRVSWCGDVAEAKKSCNEVAAAQEERNPLHAKGEVRVDIQVVAGDDVLLRVKLVQEGVVAVSKVFRVVEEVNTDLEVQPFLEDAGGVDVL